jgi:single-stranded-DNA-specific exonuclease
VKCGKMGGGRLAALGERWAMRRAAGEVGEWSGWPEGARCGEPPEVVRRLLGLRGIAGGGEAVEHLLPRLGALGDPLELEEMGVAVARVLAAVDGGEDIVLYGDYDVDGVSSLALLEGVLAAYGAKFRSFLPHRMDEGYGLGRAGLERCLGEGEPGLLIAVDCGTSSADEIRWLGERGIDVVVLDHHELPSWGRPPCVALVNPKAEEGRKYGYLCSAGVVFKLAHALMKERRVEGYELKGQLDLVALATVADIVPLVGENRLLVRHGLKVMADTARPGLVALKEVAGVAGLVDASDVGFRLGPRLNAAGRLESAQLALDLLRCRDLGEARDIARQLDANNRERQEIERLVEAEAVAQMEREYPPEGNAVLVLAGEGWHPGVVGIVASRIMRRAHRPTFVIGVGEDGEGKGSGRSVAGVSLVECLEGCRDLLLAGGGHEMAAGLRLRGEQVAEFRRRANAQVFGMGDLEVLRPVVECDVELMPWEVSWDLFRWLELLGPHGAGCPRPVFLARGVMPVGEVRVMKGKHVRVRVGGGGGSAELLYFSAPVGAMPEPPWDVAYQVGKNEYRGEVSLQMTVRGLRSAGEVG